MCWSSTTTGRVDYTLAYRDNIEGGTATVVITGIGHVTGTREVTFTISYPNPFVDVIVGTTPHAQDILWLAGKGITTGWTERDGTKTFRGTSGIIRQDMAAFLYRMAGSPPYTPTAADKAMFVDVNERTPHAKEIWWLAKTGISKGWMMPNGTREFRGTNVVIRQDMAAFLRRLADTQMGIDTKLPAGYQNPFMYVNEQTPHYEDILWLASTGVSEGWAFGNGKRHFGGGYAVVRQDMAAFLHRLYLLK